MIFRVIVGTIVLILFSVPFIMKIRKEYGENHRVSKWSIFFLVLALLIWIALLITFFGYVM